MNLRTLLLLRSWGFMLIAVGLGVAAGFVASLLPWWLGLPPWAVFGTGVAVAAFTSAVLAVLMGVD